MSKVIKDLVNGDSILLEFDIDDDITNWKIRAEIFDNSSRCIKLATSNVTGGSTNQIEVTSTSATKSTFLLKVEAGATTNLCDKSALEIEVETTTMIGTKLEKETNYKATILFDPKEIDWTDNA